MKALSYYLLLILAMLFFGARCNQEDVVSVIPPDKPGRFIDPENPTADFNGPDIRDYVEEINSSFKNNPNLYVTFFSYCNDSDHTLYILSHSSYQEAYTYSCYLKPGEKDVHVVYTEYLPEWGFIEKLLPLQDLGYIEVFYDQKNPYHTRKGIYERCHDFTQTSANACLGDEKQWYYNGMNEKLARWTYVFTNEDYDRAVKISAERTDDPQWID